MNACKCGSHAINDDPERVACDRCWRDAEIERLRLDNEHLRNVGASAQCCPSCGIMAPGHEPWCGSPQVEIERLKNDLKEASGGCRWTEIGDYCDCARCLQNKNMRELNEENKQLKLQVRKGIDLLKYAMPYLECLGQVLKEDKSEQD